MTDVVNIEEWRPVPGFPGYEASDQGGVRSLLRGQPTVVASTVGPCGFATVNPATPSGQCAFQCRRVGSLVALAWIGPRPAGSEVRRLDGNPGNDRADNLAYGTREDVEADHAARARREEAAGCLTHCPEGHRYADSWLGNWGKRLCHQCRKQKRAAYHRAHYKPKKPTETACLDCGTTVKQYPDARPVLKRCPPCRERYERQYHREWQRRNAPRVGERVTNCHGCGVELRRTGPGPVPTRCPDCKRQAQREARHRHDAKRRMRDRRTAPARPGPAAAPPGTAPNPNRKATP